MVNWEYSESVESQEIVNIQEKYQNFINGKFQQPNSKKYINTISPSTEEFLSKIVVSNEKDVLISHEAKYLTTFQSLVVQIGQHYQHLFHLKLLF